MSAKDDTIPVRLNEPKNWIDESACVVNRGIGVVRDGGGRVGIHTIRDDSRGGIYQKNRLQVSSNGAGETSRKQGIFGGMSGGLESGTGRVEGDNGRSGTHSAEPAGAAADFRCLQDLCEEAGGSGAGS